MRIKIVDGWDNEMFPSNLSADEEKDILTKLYVILYFMLSYEKKFSNISVERVSDHYFVKYWYEDIYCSHIAGCIVTKDINVKETLEWMINGSRD